METSEEFQILLNSIPDYAVFLLNPDGIISSWSTAAEKLFGYSSQDIRGKHFSCLYPEADIQDKKPHQEIRMAATHGRYEDTHWRVRRDGTQFWADSVICPLREEDGKLRGFSQVIRDITERKKSEEQLRQKEEELSQARKLESIGRLAGGVAHDFNNFITGIIGLADEIRISMEPEDTRRADLEEIIKTADRAKMLTRELLAFGRRQVSSPQVINLNDALSEKQKMLTRLLGTGIRLQPTLDSPSGNILIDPTQLDQVLVNLISNARDAMPHGGSIGIQTGRTTIEAGNSSDIPAGPYVFFTISDTGTGIDETTIPHVFEPFFTTKPKGEGTGLGLATVYGIIKQNHGDISVESRPGRGTTFRILLPEIDAPIEPEAPTDLRPLTTGTETILIAEDEQVVRKVAVKALAKHGYHLLQASSGAEALDIARQYPQTIHLLLTDVIMPAMNGRELAKQFSLLHPESVILYMSAYAEDIIQERGILEKGLAYIEKPFTGDSLTRKVQDLLHSRTPPKDS